MFVYHVRLRDCCRRVSKETGGTVLRFESLVLVVIGGSYARVHTIIMVSYGHRFALWIIVPFVVATVTSKHISDTKYSLTHTHTPYNGATIPIHIAPSTMYKKIPCVYACHRPNVLEPLPRSKCRRERGL